MMKYVTAVYNSTSDILILQNIVTLNVLPKKLKIIINLKKKKKKKEKKTQIKYKSKKTNYKSMNNSARTLLLKLEIIAYVIIRAFLGIMKLQKVRNIASLAQQNAKHFTKKLMESTNNAYKIAMIINLGTRKEVSASMNAVRQTKLFPLGYVTH